jgi:hypothetical protein
VAGTGAPCLKISDDGQPTLGTELNGPKRTPFRPFGLVDRKFVARAGHKIDGDELRACILGKKKITEDLRGKLEN